MRHFLIRTYKNGQYKILELPEKITYAEMIEKLKYSNEYIITGERLQDALDFYEKHCRRRARKKKPVIRNYNPMPKFDQY